MSLPWPGKDLAAVMLRHAWMGHSKALNGRLWPCQRTRSSILSESRGLKSSFKVCSWMSRKTFSKGLTVERLRKDHLVTMITADLLVDWPLSDRHSSKAGSLFQLYLYYVSFLAKYFPNEMHMIYWNWLPNKRKNSEVEFSIDLLENEYNNFMSTCCTRTLQLHWRISRYSNKKWYIILDRYTISSCAIVDVKGKQILGRCNAAQLRSDNPLPCEISRCSRRVFDWQ